MKYKEYWQKLCKWGKDTHTHTHTHKPHTEKGDIRQV